MASAREMVIHQVGQRGLIINGKDLGNGGHVEILPVLGDGPVTDT
jgi:hypothetical protein